MELVWLFIYVAGMIVVLFVQNYPIDLLERAMVALSRKLRLTPIVAGATFIAITSSSPEFGTAFAGVVFERSFEIGFQTIVWSALFNILIITGATGIVSKDPIKIDNVLLKRDMLYYSIILITFIFFSIDNSIIWVENAILIFLYFLYLIALKRENGGEKITGDDWKKENILIYGAIGLLGVMVFSALLVECGVGALNQLGKLLQMTIPFSVIACTFWGPGTSIVDLMMSLKLAKRGHGDSGVVNGIASNTFDIAIVLGLNGIFYNILVGPIPIDLGPALFLITLLAISIVVVTVFLFIRKKLYKFDGWLFIALFVMMLILQIYLAITRGY